jgi:hypothetical protein
MSVPDQEFQVEGFCEEDALIKWTFSLKKTDECCSVVQMKGLQGTQNCLFEKSDEVYHLRQGDIETPNFRNFTGQERV